jgi:hypothetical protein
MVFTIIATGYQPRCALDATDGAEVRISKIAAMIGECDWGIHDLSRVEVAPGDLPRFNMHLELGVHLGARLLGAGRHRRKRALILDAVPHRYDASLSDVSGQDIDTHGNDPERALGCVRDWLSEHRNSNEPRLPGKAALAADYKRFQSEVGAIIAAARLDPLGTLPHSDYLYVVRTWVDQRTASG